MMKKRSIFPKAPTPEGQLLDARLHLLDHEIVDSTGRPVGIVDDLQISGDRVTAILTGRLVTMRILGGHTPTGYLRTFAWPLVKKIGTIVQLTSHADTKSCEWSENWLRTHLIGHIPGGRHAPE
jgi:hypothetical protein